MNDGLKKATEQQLAMVKASFDHEVEFTKRLLADLERLQGSRYSSHHGHNLASRASALSRLAGQVEMLETMLRSL